MKSSKTTEIVCCALALLCGATSARAGEKTAVPTKTRMTPKAAPSAPKRVTYQVYGSYFESSNSGLQGESSYLLLPTQKAFDQVFGAAAVMGKNRFLPQDVFNSKAVVAVIRRGTTTWKYGVQSVSTRNSTLFVRYYATPNLGSGSGAGSANFASPLILTVPKVNYRSVVFIENGKQVGTVSGELAPKMARIKVYLVAVGDAGKSGRKFGCDDSLVPVTRELSAVRSPLKSALEALLSMPQRDAANAGLENFWKGRNLRLQSLSLRNGIATIHISGEISVAGVCDQPRITGQIEATARQFATVKQVRVFIEGQSLAEAIS